MDPGGACPASVSLQQNRWEAGPQEDRRPVSPQDTEAKAGGAPLSLPVGDSGKDGQMHSR